MQQKVQSIRTEEDENDVNISFILCPSKRINESLTLVRAQFYDELLNDEVKGVHICTTEDTLPEEAFNMLKTINISKDEIDITATLGSYQLDVSDVPISEMKQMLPVLEKQNFDNQFTLNVALKA